MRLNVENPNSESGPIIPRDLEDLIQQRDGAAKLVIALPQKYSCQQVAQSVFVPGPASAHNVWETCGSAYLNGGRYHEAVAIFESLYDQLLLF